MASEMRVGSPRVDSQRRGPLRSLVDIFHWSFYETIPPSFHDPAAGRLRPKPDGAIDAVEHELESFGDARARYDKRRQKPFRHRSALSKLRI